MSTESPGLRALKKHIGLLSFPSDPYAVETLCFATMHDNNMISAALQQDLKDLFNRHNTSPVAFCIAAAIAVRDRVPKNLLEGMTPSLLLRSSALASEFVTEEGKGS